MTFTNDERFVAPVARDDAGVARGGRRLHDAARPAPHHGRGAPPRPRPVGRRRRTPGAPTGRRVYYHRADAAGIGFDRTADRQQRRRALPHAGARAVRRRSRPAPRTCCSGFTTSPGTTRMSSGRTLWDELCHRYSARRRRRPPHAGDLGRRWRAFVDRARARPRAPAARDPGAGGALVAQRLPALLPDVLAPPPARRDSSRWRERWTSTADLLSPTRVAARRRRGSLTSGRGGADEGRHRARGQRGGELSVDDGHRRPAPAGSCPPRSARASAPRPCRPRS